MLIRSKIERKGGTRVTLDGKEYHFKPEQAGGPHIAMVKDQAHIARFLSITEGYQFHAVEADSDDTRGDEPLKAMDKVDSAEAQAVKAINAVMDDPLGVDDETLIKAFHFLNGRAPNPKARRLTVIDRVITKAAEAGLIQPKQADEALEAIHPAQEPEKADTKAEDKTPAKADDKADAAADKDK